MPGGFMTTLRKGVADIAATTASGGGMENRDLLRGQEPTVEA